METNIERDARLEKVKKLRDQGENPYKNGFKAADFANVLKENHDSEEAETLLKKEIKCKVSGRIILLRSFGKAAFITLQDSTGRIQAYVSKADLTEKEFELFKHSVDIGDIVLVEGTLFKTKTNELTIHARSFVLLTKAVRSLPEKFHGLTDIEQKYRQRYVDLIVNEESRTVFRKRFQIINEIRNYLARKGFFEVETPMLNAIQGGAAAKPFITHHNALDMKLFMRIAPELYLKRLIVGGFDRVFELSRVFRNEGIDTKHNPEFTLLEFYWAYATYEDLMEMTEEMINEVAQKVNGSDEFTFQGTKISLRRPWTKISVVDSIKEYSGIEDKSIVDSHEKLVAWAKANHIHLSKEASYGHVLMDIFDVKVEHKLVQPTFITQYPTAVSPLARRNEKNPEFTDRFELFFNGCEVANAFSELNDPVDQLERFEEQAKAKAAGDEEASDVDYDYVRALEYGMPPTAGEGIGIDRLVMFLTDSPSIRDVVLFPHMRPE